MNLAIKVNQNGSTVNIRTSAFNGVLNTLLTGSTGEQEQHDGQSNNLDNQTNGIVDFVPDVGAHRNTFFLGGAHVICLSSLHAGLAGV